MLANRHPDKVGLRDTNIEIQKAIRDTQCKCTAECNASLEKSTLQAAYSTDLSFNRLQGYCTAQYYEPPNEASKKRNIIHFSLISAIDMMNLLTNSQIGMIQLISFPHH